VLCDLACPVISESLEFACEALHGKGGAVVRPFACPGGHAVVAVDEGHRISEAISADPAGSARLRAARQHAREGSLTRRRADA